MVCEDVLEQISTDTRPADRCGDQHRGIENEFHDLPSARNTSSSVWMPWACARFANFERRRWNSETARNRRSASRVKSLFETPAAALCRSSAWSSSSGRRNVMVAMYYIVIRAPFRCKPSGSSPIMNQCPLSAHCCQSSASAFGQHEELRCVGQIPPIISHNYGRLLNWRSAASILRRFLSPRTITVAAPRTWRDQ